MQSDWALARIGKKLEAFYKSTRNMGETMRPTVTSVLGEDPTRPTYVVSLTLLMNSNVTISGIFKGQHSRGWRTKEIALLKLAEAYENKQVITLYNVWVKNSLVEGPPDCGVPKILVSLSEAIAIEPEIKKINEDPDGKKTK